MSPKLLDRSARHEVAKRVAEASAVEDIDFPELETDTYHLIANNPELIGHQFSDVRSGRVEHIFITRSNPEVIDSVRPLVDDIKAAFASNGLELSYDGPLINERTARARLQALETVRGVRAEVPLWQQAGFYSEEDARQFQEVYQVLSEDQRTVESAIAQSIGANIVRGEVI
jgi:hypothetical protein